MGKYILWLLILLPATLSVRSQEKDTENNAYFRIGKFKEVHNPAWGITDDPWCINDHTFIYNRDTKRWHVIGITHSRKMDYIRDPGVNLLHVSADSLFQRPWNIHPHALTADPEKYRESVLWAPHCIFHKGKYYLFACAGSQQGAHIHDSYQINLYLSDDLFIWKRYENNPLLTDGFDARDPVILKDGKQWILYYTANSTPDGGNHIIAAYTSKDLLHWKNRRIVFIHSREGTFGGPTESPFVLKRGQWYYMFLCDGGHTDVYRSKDPFHFTMDDLIAEIQDCRASEIIRDDKGNYYISSAGWFGGDYGLKIAPVVWLDETKEKTK
ncbi:MAG: family 43 glycosylhydrolase [Dysgonamonadaceae bacterium]|jgi:beta-fructofuranosidase|nr:family 43 glycosylhydrolase [Dysgonamonadaceae bacterium]